MLLSRVADSLYWLSRYLERAEHTARLIYVRLDLGLDKQADRGGWDFERLYASLRIKPADPLITPAALVEALVFNPSNRESVLAGVTAARENARQVREQISSEMWEQLNRLYLRLMEARIDGTASARPHYAAHLVIEGIHLFQGVTDATMGQDEGWQYLQAGRFLERASSTSALLDLHVRSELQARGGSMSQPYGSSMHHPLSDVEWVGLLRSCCALEAYCRCYTADIRPERIADFLLLNAEFPRSVRFAAARVESALRAISHLTGRDAGGRAARLAGRLHASLDYGQVDEILGDDPHGYLDGIGLSCAQVHAAIYQSFIAYPIETALPA
jgi:uncharacterized alpha-E superfamily protein